MSRVVPIKTPHTLDIQWGIPPIKPLCHLYIVHIYHMPYPNRNLCLLLSRALQHLGLLIRVVPIKESHTLDIQWDIPPTEPLYRKAPTNYLSHLLGHEGAGSAFALLKSRGLVTSLSAGEGGGLSSRGFFGVRVELTQEGNQKIGEVVEVIFKYLDLLRLPEAISEQVCKQQQQQHKQQPC